jgi:Tfp pilus assembly protein PilO
MAILIQTPMPPLPPEAPLVFHSGPPEWVGFVAALSLVVVAIILFPLARALARRLEGKGSDPLLRGELQHLHERVADVEQLEQRLAELENRVEFSERLLAQHREAQLQRPGTSA